MGGVAQGRAMHKIWFIPWAFSPTYGYCWTANGGGVSPAFVPFSDEQHLPARHWLPFTEVMDGR